MSSTSPSKSNRTFYYDVDINDLIWALQKFKQPSNKMLHVKLLSHKFYLCQSLNNIDNVK